MHRLPALMLVAIFVAGCTHYAARDIPFRPPQAYENHQESGGLIIGGEAFADRKVAKKAFGFDVKGTGLLPVQIVMTNNGPGAVKLVPGQTFLVDNENRYWPVVPTAEAAERVEKSTEFSSFFGSGAGKGAVLGATAGTVLGAALGIVSGGSVGESLGKGAALGAAGGAIVGGTSEGSSPERRRTVWDDIRAKGIEGKKIPAGSLAHGFIFFPGNAESAKEVRLQFLNGEGEVRNVILDLAPRAPQPPAQPKEAAPDE